MVMRSWMASTRLHKGPLTEGQKQAVKLILSSKDRVVGVQGYAGTGKTTMLRRANALAGKSGYRMMGLAPSASAVKTLGGRSRDRERDPAIASSRGTPGSPKGRLDEAKGEKEMRAAFAEDRARGGRGIPRLHGPGPRSAQDRERAPRPPRGPGRRRETARRGRRRQTLCAVAAGRA